jgi:muconolactone delta-isomerase
MSLPVSASSDMVPLRQAILRRRRARPKFGRQERLPTGGVASATEASGMQFLVITRRLIEKFSDAAFAELLGAEAARARDLYARGAFRALHSRGDVPGAVITVEADTAAEVAALVDSLPFAQHKMMEFEIVPLLPYPLRP